jgi:hypothetical protein
LPFIPPRGINGLTPWGYRIEEAVMAMKSYDIDDERDEVTP